MFTEDEIKKGIIEIILKKDEFIYNNTQIFKYNLNFVDESPEGMKNNKNNILQKKNLLVKMINNCEKPYLEETIINIFEYKILNYFKMISKLELKDFDDNPVYRQQFEDYYRSVINKSPNETLIIFNLSLDLFSECIEFLDSYLNESSENKEGIKENQNLFKLYAISYIKIYLSKLVHFIYEKEQFIPNIQKIIDIISKDQM